MTANNRGHYKRTVEHRKLMSEIKLLNNPLKGITSAQKGVYKSKITKEELEYQYYKKIKSLSEIANQVGVTAVTILNYMKRYRINRRNLCEAQKIASKCQRGKTFEELYGVIQAQKMKERMGRAHRGRPLSLEHKIQLSLGRTGDKVFRGFKTSKRFRIRASNPYKQWRKNVFKRDDFTCQIFGIRGEWKHPIEVHHLESFDKNPELRFDVDNGITLLKCVHIEFHNIYGKGDNNRKQFKDFKKLFEKYMGLRHGL